MMHGCGTNTVGRRRFRTPGHDRLQACKDTLKAGPHAGADSLAEYDAGAFARGVRVEGALERGIPKCIKSVGRDVRSLGS